MPFQDPSPRSSHQLFFYSGGLRLYCRDPPIVHKPAELVFVESLLEICTFSCRVGNRAWGGCLKWRPSANGQFWQGWPFFGGVGVGGLVQGNQRESNHSGGESRGVAKPQGQSQIWGCQFLAPLRLLFLIKCKTEGQCWGVPSVGPHLPVWRGLEGKAYSPK